jgi:hypothetical protein
VGIARPRVRVNGSHGQVNTVRAFHINADEPSALDYNVEYKSIPQLTTLYQPDAFRAADHDPLLVDMSLVNAAPVFTHVDGPLVITQSETVTLSAAAYDPDGGAVTYAWDLDNDGTFETQGQSVSFSGAGKVGNVTVKVRATDVGGQSATAPVVITVHFDWSGFFAPVKSGGALNVAKAGSAVPLKFTLGGDQGLAIFKTGFPVSIPVACDASDPGTGEPTANPGHSGLTYDSGQYAYVWKTDRSWAGTCRLVVVTLVDESTHQAMFRFK